MIVGPNKKSPFLYRGTGLIADKQNPLVLEVLTASSTAYSYKPDSPIEEVVYSKHYLYVVKCYSENYCFSILMLLAKIRYLSPLCKPVTMPESSSLALLISSLTNSSPHQFKKLWYSFIVGLKPTYIKLMLVFSM
jgi:hypothetical protein